jgi:methyl-accepting chemotaxis protein
MAILDRYEALLWRSMRTLGVDRSIERKILAAVSIQFLISIGQTVVPFVATGSLRLVLVAGLFATAAVAFANTVLVTRRDLVAPVSRLEATAREIASGETDVAVDPPDQADEVGGLSRSFAAMVDYLDTVSAQADALARQRFDADVLDEDVPGEFGESLSRMADSLRSYTAELESTTADLERRSERLERLVDAFADAAGRARDGDLTATIDVDAVVDESDADGADVDRYREVCENYNDLVRTLGNTVGEVDAFADEVATASADVSANVDEIDRASDEVAASVQEISDGAARQTERLQTVAGEVNDLSATVEQIAASADTVAETAETAAERGRSGREAAVDAGEALGALDDRIGETAAAVEGLADRIEEIDEIVAFIDEIAEETNMLALNASIEAARAGEAGDGFAVVADEVKRLAEETRASAEEVRELIADVQTESERTAATVREMDTQVGDSIDTIEAALADFEDIVGVVDDLHASVREISDATDTQAETTQDVVASVDEVAGIGEETAAEAETAAAAAQQQTASVSAVSEDVGTLAERAATLQVALGEFRLPDETAGVDGSAAVAAATDRREVVDRREATDPVSTSGDD